MNSEFIFLMALAFGPGLKSTEKAFSIRILGFEVTMRVGGWSMALLVKNSSAKRDGTWLRRQWKLWGWISGLWTLPDSKTAHGASSKLIEGRGWKATLREFSPRS